MSSDPTLFQVEPDGGGWLITIPGDSVEEHALTRAQAIARAMELARGATRARVVVLARDGHVEQELDVDAQRGT